ncbi:MAG TPA: polyphenol oxidase family protein, partial [Chloroflexota bacterium]|nr:polyphenol oxidase family protein [Chloroflexota bacterium]
MIEAVDTGASSLSPGDLPDVFHFAFGHAALIHGVAGRSGGVSEPPFDSLNLSVKAGDEPAAVLANRRLLESHIGDARVRFALGRLRHGNDVVVFQTGGLIPALAPPSLGDWPMFDADAAVSDVPGIMLVMTFADCVPVTLYDAEHQACGLAHAGWRGTAKRICSNTVRTMVQAFGTDPSALHVGIGPSIGSCCYTVGADVRDEFTAAYGAMSDAWVTEGRLDLWEA